MTDTKIQVEPSKIRVFFEYPQRNVRGVVQVWNDLRVEYDDERLERREFAAWALGPVTRRTNLLRDRLAAAIKMGRVFKPEATIKTDVAGKTYLSVDTVFKTRFLTAELDKLGM
jgi:hypothetical protein